MNDTQIKNVSDKTLANSLLTFVEVANAVLHNTVLSEEKKNHLLI